MNHPLMESTEALGKRADGGNARASGILRFLPVAALSVAAAMLVGCGSSSSGPRRGGGGDPGFERAPAQFAADQSKTFAATVEDGDDVTLPLHHQGIEASDTSRSLVQGEGNDANFRLRVSGGQPTVTIETRSRDFEWDGVTIENGDLSAYHINAGPPTVETELVSTYLDYVHFGHWGRTEVGTGGEFSMVGGAFHQGFETRAADLPNGVDVNYAGSTSGRGVHATEGEYSFDGTVALQVNFATGAVSGDMLTNINDFSVNGTISNNRFSGDIEVTGGSGSVSFANGTTGSLAGGFYGAAGEEVGGTYGISDANNTAAGAFGATQQP